MNWIKVSERLPETDRTGMNNDILFSDGEFNYYGMFQDDGGGEYQFIQYAFGSIKNVTHWCKPTLPEQ